MCIRAAKGGNYGTDINIKSWKNRDKDQPKAGRTVWCVSKTVGWVE